MKQKTKRGQHPKTKQLMTWGSWLLLALLFFGCKPPEKTTETAVTHGIFVLNEGNWHLNNSTITYYNLETGEVIEDIFEATNHRKLGDTGNDLQQYGRKLYCVVNESEIIEVMDLKCKSLKQISLTGKQPRKIAFHGGKAYVCCFDGDVVQIDTLTLTIGAMRQAGRNPEGLCVANNKLYVANSGGLDFPNYDNTVSVFNLATFSLTKTITVALNPSIIKSDPVSGYVYLVSKGNYDNIPAVLQKIDSQTDNVVQTYSQSVYNFALDGNTAYVNHVVYENGSPKSLGIKVLNLQTGDMSANPFITDNTTLQQPYGIHIVNGNIFITDAFSYTVNGDVYGFDKTGRKRYKFEAGISPSVVLEVKTTVTTEVIV
ncbi:MAG: YncE family protein [Bacteroidales bacterium]|nr:YncE family protein [Bacteroidales bacterium]